MGKKKVVLEIENLFRKTEVNTLSFQKILDSIDERRSTILGVLSSHPRIFHKVKKNQWELIPDEVSDLDAICIEYEINREDFDSLLDDSDSLRYSWIRIKKQGGGFSRREVHYLIHTMRKEGRLKLPDRP
jgi:hypothetical protein